MQKAAECVKTIEPWRLHTAGKIAIKPQHKLAVAIAISPLGQLRVGPNFLEFENP